MRRLSKRERYLIIIVLILAILGLFLYYYYFPLQDEIEDLQEKSRLLSLDIEDAKLTKELLEITRQEKKELEEKSLDHEELLMASIDEPILLKYIDDIVIEDSQDQTLNYASLVENELYVQKDINLNFATEYESLKNILEEFEEGDYYSTINSISINMSDSSSAHDEDEEDEMPLNVDYSIRFYGVEGNWDGQGVYEFMDRGNYEKPNPFE